MGVRRCSVAAFLLVLAAVSSVQGGEIVARSPMAKDAAYLALAPREQLQKLADLKAEGKAPSDLKLLRAEALRRYLSTESKGSGAEEITAYEKLMGDEKLKGFDVIPNYEGVVMNFPVYAALVNDPAFKGGSTLDRFKVLNDLKKRKFDINDLSSYMEQWLLVEHVASKSLNVPVKDRGTVKLKALAELATGSPHGEATTPADGTVGKFLWDQALGEHLAMLETWDGMRHEARVAHIEALRKEYKMNLWAGLEVEAYHAQMALEEMPEYAAGDAAAKKKLAQAFIKRHSINQFVASRLEANAEGKRRTWHEKRPVVNLATEIGSMTDYSAAHQKIKTLTRDKTIYEDEYIALTLVMAYKHLLGTNPAKVLKPAEEVALWKEYGTNESKTPLKMIDPNNFGPADLTAIVSAMVSEPSYAKGTWVDRYKLLAKQQQNYYVFAAPFFRPRTVLLNMALAQEGLKVPAATRGEAMIKTYKELLAVHGPNFQPDSSPDGRAMSAAMTMIYAEKKTPLPARAALVNGFIGKNEAAKRAFGDALVQAVADGLSSDAAFMAAAAPAKKEKIEAMRKSDVIDYSVAGDLKRHFKCE